MAALIPHDCNSENPIMKRTLVRHFAAKNYDGISNLLRHLDIQKARAQAFEREVAGGYIPAPLREPHGVAASAAGKLQRPPAGRKHFRIIF